MAPSFDEATVRQFLEMLQRDWFHLLASDPSDEKPGKMRGYVAESIDDALQWMREADRKRHSIYFALNVPSNKQAKKAKKDDLRWLYGVHVDIDLPDHIARDSPEAERWIKDAINRVMADTRIPGRPHVIMSGNGVQGLWLFPEPMRATRENQMIVERVNRQLIAAFETKPGTHNSERVLRVPGTVNYPTKAKRVKGFTPVLAQLVHVTRDDYEPDDFHRLPPPSDASKSGYSARHIDYGAVPYRDWGNPYTWEDFRRSHPTILEDMTAAIDGTPERDRSAGLWLLASSVSKFLYTRERVAADVLLEDRDYLKNAFEICAECDHPAMSHYDEHALKLGKLGYDLQRAIAEQVADGRGWTERGEAKAEQKAKNFELSTTPADKRDPLECRSAFMEYVGGALPRVKLPNCQGGDEPAARQLPTESNMRAVLAAAQITARWDAMRDEARYVVNPDAFERGREPGTPRQNFDRALAGTHADMRAVQEESLILDSFTTYGIVARRELPDLLKAIAREYRYHPIEDYCAARPWDGVRRIDQIADCLHSDHPLKREYLHVFFRSCVAASKSLRRYNRTGRGEQLSSVITLIGSQGIGKSTFWERIVPAGFLSKGTSLKLGQNGEVDSKRECLGGLVCVLNEVGQTFSRSEGNALKEFLSCTVDEFRTAYARNPISKPRMTTFCGTANKDFQLGDQTGSRRYLTMMVKRIDFNRLADIDLQQVYAEAWHAVMIDGEAWWLSDEDDEIRAQHNEQFRAVMPEEAALDAYVSSLGERHEYHWLTAAQICDLLRIAYAPSRWNVLKNALNAEGFVFREKVTCDGVRYRRVYSMPTLPEKWMAFSTMGRG